MAIEYPVDVENTKWTVYQVDIAKIIDTNRGWPRPDGGPIVGHDENFAYLLQTTDARPDADYRLYTLITQKGIDVPSNVIHTSYTTEKRPVDEIITAIENEESSQLARHFDVVQELKSTRLMVTALLKFAVDAQGFPAKAQAMYDEYVAVGTKLWKNRDRADELKDAANADDDVLIDDGWEAP